MVSVFSFFNLTENYTSAAVGVSPVPSEKAPDSQLHNSHWLKLTSVILHDGVALAGFRQ